MRNKQQTFTVYSKDPENENSNNNNVVIRNITINKNLYMIYNYYTFEAIPHTKHTRLQLITENK